MAMIEMDRDGSIAGRRRCDEAAFRRLLVVTYPVFLAIAIGRAALSAVGLVRNDGPRGSVFHRAKATAHAVLPFAFMG